MSTDPAPADESASGGEAPPEDDPEEAARARLLFSQGVELAANERWAHAIDAFEQALELRSAPAIRYNLAAALVESGRYRDAHAQLLALEADPDTPENLALLGQTLRERLGTEAAHLHIERAPAIASAEVVLDTLPVPESMISTHIPVRPGEHRIAATRGAEMLAAITVTAPAGELTRAVLGPVNLQPDPDPPGGSSIAEDPLFWLGLGGAAVLVAAAVVLLVVLLPQDAGEPVAGNFEPAIITWP